jgi:hypothetical protein
LPPRPTRITEKPSHDPALGARSPIVHSVSLAVLRSAARRYLLKVRQYLQSSYLRFKVADVISSYNPPLLPRCLPLRFAFVAAPPWSRSAHQSGVSRRPCPVARRSGMRIGQPVSGSPNFAASDESYGVGQVGDGDANAPVGGFRFVRWRRSRPGGGWPKVTSARFDPPCNSLRGAPRVTQA